MPIRKRSTEKKEKVTISQSMRSEAPVFQGDVKYI